MEGIAWLGTLFKVSRECTRMETEAAGNERVKQGVDVLDEQLCEWMYRL